jgi:hypothetical protein
VSDIFLPVNAVSLLSYFLTCYMFGSGWTVQFAKTAYDSSKQHSAGNVDTTTSTVATTGPSTSILSQSQSSVIMETSPVAPPVSKRAKLFYFLSRPSNVSSSTGAAANTSLIVKDIGQQFTLFASDKSIAGQGLQVFNDDRFNGLRPLARKLFTAPASSAASERVFSRAGLIMRPTRSRLSKANLSKLVFLCCNADKL